MVLIVVSSLLHAANKDVAKRNNINLFINKLFKILINSVSNTEREFIQWSKLKSYLCLGVRYLNEAAMWVTLVKFPPELFPFPLQNAVKYGHID